MNCFILHGMSSYLEQGIGLGLIPRLKNLGLNLIIPHFTLKEKITFDNWENSTIKYKNEFTNSIVICHSLSSLFIIKFLHKHNLKCKCLITIGGGFSDKIDNSKFYYLKDFIPSNEDFKYIRTKINYRYSFYSNDDDIFTQKQLKEYVNMLSSKSILKENCGHFGIKSGVKDIPEIEEIITSII